MPFTRMLYIGDGDTDIPSMKMVRHQGGFSIAVFDPGQWRSGPNAQDKISRLIAEDRVRFVAPGDYGGESARGDREGDPWAVWAQGDAAGVTSAGVPR